MDTYTGPNVSDYSNFKEPPPPPKDGTADDDEDSTTIEKGPPRLSVTADQRGPVHTLLKLGYHDMMHTVYEHDTEVISRFWYLVLPEAVGKRKWNKLSKGLQVSNFVTKSDEAFAMVMVENNAGKWLHMLLHPELTAVAKRRIPTKYTLTDDQQSGWSNEGIYRFTELNLFVAKYRHSNRQLVQHIDRLCSRKFGQSNLQRRDKRKLDDFMNSLNAAEQLSEQRKREEIQRKKDEKMNEILLNMCMKGDGYDIVGDQIAI